MLLFQYFWNFFDKYSIEVKKDSPKTHDAPFLIEHTGITIDELNESLSWNSFDWITGEGTQETPYQIRNIAFHGTNYSLFRILNAQSYCIISNCSFSSDGYKQDCLYAWWGGIEIINSSYITVEYSQIHNYPTGIYMRESSELMINNNQIYGSQEGIYIQYSCHHIQIQNNIIPDAKYSGIGIGFIEFLDFNFEEGWLGYQSNIGGDDLTNEITVFNNSISSSRAGISNIKGKSNITFKNNIITNCRYGEAIFDSYSHYSFQNIYRNNSFGTTIIQI